MARLLGTAGHVDHGKTTLIRALTGTDADRLPEEKKRGLTIDLGYASLELPKAGPVSIVDVPGHERFVTNMLAGATSIGTALLCVAADEGVMPQTREHFSILQLLPVSRLVVAITKSDTMPPESAMQDVAELLKETRFAGSPMVAVSAQSGAGLDELKSALDEALSEPAETGKPWHLPVDRVFTVKGHGTVITGSLAGGTVKAGSEAIIQPGSIKVRIKAIHVHDEPQESAEPGMRVALNLTGVDAKQVSRGCIVGEPGSVIETDRLDVRLSWLEKPRHAETIRLAIGAADHVGRVFLNDHDEDLAQVVLPERAAVVQGAPIVIRRHSPADLLGGGSVTRPQATPRRKSDKVSAAAPDAPLEQQIIAAAEQSDGIALSELAQMLGREADALKPKLQELLEKGHLHAFGGRLLSPDSYAGIRQRFTDALGRLHDEHPKQAAFPREQATKAAGLTWTHRPLERLLQRLAQEEVIRLAGAKLALPGRGVELTEKQERFLSRLCQELDKELASPPSPDEIAQRLNVPPQAVVGILRLGVESERLHRIEEGIYITASGEQVMRQKLREQIGEKPFSPGDVRSAIGGSRKTLIPLLEWWDKQGFTLRQGGQRRIVG